MANIIVGHRGRYTVDIAIDAQVRGGSMVEGSVGGGRGSQGWGCRRGHAGRRGSMSATAADGAEAASQAGAQGPHVTIILSKTLYKCG